MGTVTSWTSTNPISWKEGSAPIMNGPVMASTTSGRLTFAKRPSPNPLVSRSVFAYSVGRDVAANGSVPVRLTLHDVRGRTVRTLVNEHQSAGPRQVICDGSSDRGKRVASGVSDSLPACYSTALCTTVDLSIGNWGGVEKIVERIRSALQEAGDLLLQYQVAELKVAHKERGDPVTEADVAADRLLRRLLPRNDEAWLSEESEDDLDRLQASRLWIVDPIDGTKDFLAGRPQWSVSVGFVENGRALAGGIYNPVTAEMILGSLTTGVECNRHRMRMSQRPDLDGASVLTSHRESRRPEWQVFATSGLVCQPMGSVAYKLALVGIGRFDATWSLRPKSEWDVAAGTAIIEANGGRVTYPDGREPRFNRKNTTLPGIVAANPELHRRAIELLRSR